jgi:hypothetical protein
LPSRPLSIVNYPLPIATGQWLYTSRPLKRGSQQQVLSGILTPFPCAKALLRGPKLPNAGAKLQRINGIQKEKGENYSYIQKNYSHNRGNYSYNSV